jgi:hypothetical protein
MTPTLARPSKALLERHHLLARSILAAAASWSDGCFAFLYPQDNAHCSRAVTRYRECLTDERTFAEWTIEAVLEAIASECDAEWVRRFRDRYVDFGPVDEAIAG